MLKDMLNKLFSFRLIFLFVLLMSQPICAKGKQIDIRTIHDKGAWDDKSLTRRMLAISNEDFITQWQARSIENNFFVLGDYFMYEAFMPHFGAETSYLCYNPKSNKLSIAYREVLWDEEWEDINEKAVIHLATEEEQFPIEICRAGFGEVFYKDSLVYLSASPIIDTYSEDVPSTASDYILSGKYNEALKILEHQYDSTCIEKINVWDSINHQRFVEFREYLLTLKSCKVYTPLILECIEKSISIFYDVDALNMGSWWPSCNLRFEDGHPSMEYAIKAYSILNTTQQYDSCLAQCHYELAVYQLNYMTHMSATTRDKIKENFQLAHSYYNRLNDPKSVLATYWLGFEYKQEKDLGNAIKYFELSQKLAKNYYGIESEEYAMVLNRLRDIYYESEQYDKAAEIARHYVAIVNKLDLQLDIFSFTMQTDNYSHQLSVYSDFQAKQEYEIFTQCTVSNVWKKKIMELEEYHTQKGNWHWIVKLRKELYDNEEASYWIQNRLISLAEAYRQIGDFASEEHYRKIWANNIKEQHGDNSEEYAMALLELCKVYQSQNDDTKAFQCADKAMQIEFGGQNHYKILDILRGCGDYSVWSGKLKSAEVCYKQIVEISKNSWGLGYLNTTKRADLEPLANVYLLMGDTTKALETIFEIIDLGKQPDGKEIHNYSFLGNFAERINNDTIALSYYYDGGLYDEVERILYNRKDFKTAEYFITQHFDSLKNVLNQEIVSKRESDREAFWNQNNYYLTQTLPQYCYEAYMDSVDYSTLAYDVALFTKGYLLSTSKTIQNVIMSSNDEELIKKWRELLMLQEVLTQPLASDSIALLKERARYIEQQILSTNAELLQASQKQSITTDEVRTSLKGNELAIEFTSFYDSNANARRYGAVLIKKSFKTPIYISLFTENDIASYIERGPQFTYFNASSLFDLIWLPIQPYIQSKDKIYFAADGILHNLNIEILEDKNGCPISNYCDEVIRVSSTREIALREKENRASTSTLFGGILYDVTEDDMLAESMQYENYSLLASRSIENDTLNRGSVKYLPGTKKEAEMINTLLKENQITAKLYTSSKANEESFKSLSGKHNNIIHIGTHGFTWTDSIAKKQDYFTQRFELLSKEREHSTTIDPLTRCGLLFAGSNIALSGHSSELPDGVQDGILTAKEISLMDLRDANLVVLSACETAKGDITSEGVFGLQRAFKMAGVQTIIMSLWKVNDQATQLLMTEFYNNWIGKHQSKREAFRNAQNTVRTQYEEPVYWSGFIMLD
jgi:CHAT domain-containing protein